MRDGTLVLVGVPQDPHPSPGIFNLLLKRRRIAGSIIGGIPEPQEMLDFCAVRCGLNAADKADKAGPQLVAG